MAGRLKKNKVIKKGGVQFAPRLLIESYEIPIDTCLGNGRVSFGHLFLGRLEGDVSFFLSHVRRAFYAMQPIKVYFINNTGEGFADYVEVAANTTVGDFFKGKFPTREHTEFRIRVNREPCVAGQLLKDNDRLSITPRNVKGA